LTSFEKRIAAEVNPDWIERPSFVPDDLPFFSELRQPL